MAKTLRLRSAPDPRVDAYIKKAQPFARPILAHLRKVVHQTIPEVEETMKWSSPHFDYKGMFCGIAAFKEHVADLLAALAKNKKANATFKGFPPGQQRDYVSWAVEAKQALTREKRIKTAVEWMAEGKIRNWKYAR